MRDFVLKISFINIEELYNFSENTVIEFCEPDANLAMWSTQSQIIINAFLFDNKCTHTSLFCLNLSWNKRERAKEMNTDNLFLYYDLALLLFCSGFTCKYLTVNKFSHKVINHQPYDQKADVFSFSIVLWELVTAKV